jgi:hypothetical protein
MKKLLLTIAALASFSAGSFAQLADGSVAPDWTFTDLNGNSHHLYDLLDQGKTVFIDVSAAWCGPCWNYHQSGALENLYLQHGPSGSVSQDVEVFFIEGESTNTTAQLNGTSSGTGNATYSQGDWVTGTPYPIMDPVSADITTFNNNYNIGYFPTIYMVCRDHLVYEVGQLSTADLYAKAQAGCPTTAPSATLDAKAVMYSGTPYFICNATPVVKFQNYSTTQSITSATINVYGGSPAALVTSYNWTGNLAPFAVATVPVPSFAGTVYEPYKFDVVVAGDTYAANNESGDAFKVFTAASALTTPQTEGFESTPSYEMPGRFQSDANMFVIGGADLTSLITADGMNGKAVAVNFYGMTAGTISELFLGNFNTAGNASAELSFDVAYAQYDGTENDKLEVMVSTNCGQSWTSAWSKAGDALETHAPVGASTQFIPTAAADWRHEGADLSAYMDANMLVKIKATSGYGNFAWLDNLRLGLVTGINEVVAENSINVYPNPAKDMAYVSFNVTKSTNVNIQVIDATGRVVANVVNENMNAGTHKVDVSTATLAAGVYNVKIQTEAGSRIVRLSVIK